jgi:hypothetical protein
MRTILSFAVLFSLVAAAPAADPPKPDKEAPQYAPAPPTVMLAKAVSTDGKVTLKVTIRECVFLDEAYTVTQEIIKKVDGKDVKELVPVTKTRKVCKAVQKEVDVPLADSGVAVTDLEGKAISPADLLKRLEKQSPILRSWGGSPDPYYLQTTKPDTLILVTPLPPALPVVPAPPRLPPPGTKPLPVPPEKVPLPAPPAKPNGEFEPNATEQEIIDLTNAERKKANLPALTASPQLVKAARLHSANMAK